MTGGDPRDRAAALMAVTARSHVQVQPLLSRAHEALSRSRALLSLPIYPHDPVPWSGRSPRDGELP